ncbi:hypothetical protein [Ruminiclostridium papyrosolvens]|uniref:Phage tail protein n=1 Tax=Ruminiclostridium papyrosolvens C7 TaxID=1330534 RepID=U4QWQ5_9FIRM|nr:hypothetical protein [Ruminiclostridium papyrosolvens]EPR07764.1 hypothetical protein L323_19885 [Ruminiclostridium papyrosolvens C7]
MLKVNGKAYDWGDVDVKLPGLSLEVQEISYDDELEKELAYGKGQKPRGYGEGNYKAEGKLSMLRDDYDALLDYCKSKKTPIFKLVIPMIIVSYANDGDRTRSDVLKTVTFTKRSNKAAQGDKSLKIDLDILIVGGIESDGVAAL